MRTPPRNFVFRLILSGCVFVAAISCPQIRAQSPDVLPGTTELNRTDDLAAAIVAGADRFLLRKIEASSDRRSAYWADVQNSPADGERRANEQKMLAGILGVRDDRPMASDMQLMSTPTRSAELARGNDYQILAVRWQAIDGVFGEGLLLQPTGAATKCVVAIPDCEQTPELVANSEYVRRLAGSGCRVVIPYVVSRRVTRRRQSELTDREYLYRSSFELGRQLAGYEIQKVLAVVDWFESLGNEKASNDVTDIGVIGWGEGGRLALLACALDDRIGATCVSGYFGSRHEMWNEPIDRNVFGLLNRFGDAEIASLKHDRKLVLDAAPGPVASVRTRGGAPYELKSVTFAEMKAEARRISRSSEVRLIDGAARQSSEGPAEGTVSDAALVAFASQLDLKLSTTAPNQIEFTNPAAQGRTERQIAEIERYNQRLLAKGAVVRNEFMKGLKRDSVETHAATVEPYREIFRRDVIGQFDEKLLPAQPRTRKVFDQPTWTGYEVVLDVFPNVIAYGILQLPKDLRPGERRPVVVCQHGLEGRPRNVIEKDHPAYHDYATQLVERGFITFSPQNLYIGGDDFRTLQRKANPLGKTLFSIIVPQHQQIVDWLATLPNVDPERIAFYGLSYGGKSAMRIPPLVERYCLSICSADFNDWVWKNATTLSPYSYVWTGEYEIFEWDLGSTFNYSEMAALIAPRPFMVERGHFDGVAPDERVALEFAKVRHLYQAKLGIGDRCELEFFVGPHTINGKGTFDFLHRHLNWPKR